jgi:hypothetical protein
MRNRPSTMVCGLSLGSGEVRWFSGEMGEKSHRGTSMGPGPPGPDFGGAWPSVYGYARRSQGAGITSLSLVGVVALLAITVDSCHDIVMAANLDRPKVCVRRAGFEGNVDARMQPSGLPPR